MTRLEYLETNFDTVLTEYLVRNNPKLTQLTEQIPQKDLSSKPCMVFRINSETKSGWLYRGQLIFVPDHPGGVRGNLYGNDLLFTRTGANSPRSFADTASTLGQRFALTVEVSLPWLPTEDISLLKLKETVLCSLGTCYESAGFEMFDSFSVRGTLADSVSCDKAIASDEVQPFVVYTK